MKRILFFITSLIFIAFISCQKLDYGPQIISLKSQVDALEKSRDSLANVLKQANSNISSLQKSRDSLSKALGVTDSVLNKLNITNTSIIKSLDSIKTQLLGINTQITSLSSQLTSTNVNVTSINSQLLILNQQYSDLLIRFNTLITQLNNIAPLSLTNGLIAYYPFTGNANDSSGNGYNGTVSGATLTTDRYGNSNSAYNFDGNQFITGNANNFPSGNSQRSVSIWYNAINLGQLGFSKLLFGYGGGICGNSFNIYFENTDLGPGYIGQYEIQGHCQAFRTNTSYPLPANNQWHNIIITYGSDNLLRFYNDGILNLTSGLVSINSVVLNKIFVIGSVSSQDGTTVYSDILYKKFIGKIDDIRIYNRALSQSEITYLATH